MSFFNLCFWKLKALYTNCIRSFSNENFLTLNASKLARAISLLFSLSRVVIRKLNLKNRQNIKLHFSCHKSLSKLNISCNTNKKTIGKGFISCKTALVVYLLSKCQQISLLAIKGGKKKKFSLSTLSRLLILIIWLWDSRKYFIE